MYTFHLLTLPHAKVTKDYVHCAFTQKILNMTKMFGIMDKDWKLITYGTEWWETNYGDFVVSFSQEQFNKVYPTDHKTKLFDSTNPEWWKLYCDQTIEEIQKRRTGKDILLISYGYAHEPIKRALWMPTIEMGIGYPASMKDCYRIFESYAWMYTHYGNDRQIVSWHYDTVIPNYFDTKDFIFNDKPKEYYVFIGRASWDKWRQIAVDVCIELGKELKLAGQGWDTINEYLVKKKQEGKDISKIEHIWRVGQKEKNELVRNAIAQFVPTLYVEPFAWVQIEALLCWTPIITSDSWVFNETNHQWVTGWRCKHYQDYLEAVRRIGEIERKKCRRFGEKYSLENIMKYYRAYFEKITTVVEHIAEKGDQKERYEDVKWLDYNVFDLYYNK